MWTPSKEKVENWEYKRTRIKVFNSNISASTIVLQKLFQEAKQFIFYKYLNMDRVKKRAIEILWPKGYSNSCTTQWVGYRYVSTSLSYSSIYLSVDPCIFHICKLFQWEKKTNYEISVHGAKSKLFSPPLYLYKLSWYKYQVSIFSWLSKIQSCLKISVWSVKPKTLHTVLKIQPW